MRSKVFLGLGWGISLVAAFFVGDYWDLHKSTIIPTKYGRFLSKPKVEFIGKQEAKLLEDFVYVDPNGSPWLAPKDTKINGASIPREFWSLIGSPFSGKYFNASIVHDSECVLQKRRAEKVHLMFFHACLAGGVPQKKRASESCCRCHKARYGQLLGAFSYHLVRDRTPQ